MKAEDQNFSNQAPYPWQNQLPLQTEPPNTPRPSFRLGGGQAPTLGYGDYLRFRDLVLDYSGLHFPEKKKTELETGLFKALADSPIAASGNHNLDQYYQLLSDRSNPVGRAELNRLINTLTIGETHFFRDEAQFNVLATNVLPALINRKRAAAAAIGPQIQPQLRIWSAGCASGEEPYSLAILLKELLPDISNWRILILATDINQESLARAREGLYSDWSFRENRAKTLRGIYFKPEPARSSILGSTRYRLSEDIRQMVTFASLNLIDDPYPSTLNNTISMDLIICRNVTIYFTEETTRQVIKRFYDALLESGWLVVGHSEPSLVIYRAFQTVSFPDTMLYQKTGQPTPWPADWEWLAKGAAASEQSPARGFTPSPGSPALPHASANGTPPPTNSNLARPAAPATKPIRPIARPVEPKRPLSPPPASIPDRDSYEVAGHLLHRGQLWEAIAELQRKLAIAPDFAPAHSLLGRAYANMGNWEEARRWCQSGLKLDNLLVEAYYVLALVYEHEGQREQAIDMLKKVIYLDRSAPLPHLNLAMLYRKTGQARDAQRACQNAIRILDKLPPGTLVADSGGSTAFQLGEVCRRLLAELEGTI